MALEPIRIIRGRGVFVPGDDIDTDRIIPARFLRCVTFDGLGDALFRDARFHDDGTDKPHPLNEARFQGASIMITGSNFGCGSSREHAPQAIYRAGFQAVIAVSFAEIFFGNSVTLGMPCIEASEEQVRALASAVAANPQAELVIDIPNETVSVAGQIHDVFIRPAAKQVLVEGRWDPLAELLEGNEQVVETAERLGYASDSRGG